MFLNKSSMKKDDHQDKSRTRQEFETCACSKLLMKAPSTERNLSGILLIQYLRDHGIVFDKMMKATSLNDNKTIQV